MGTLTTDKEEALLRGYIPLGKEILKLLTSGEKIKEINFHGNGYVTDAVLQLIKRKCKSKDVFSELSVVNLVGSDQITDYGVRCLLEAIGEPTQLQEIDLSGCRHVSDPSFALLSELHGNTGFRCGLKGTSVAYLTGTSTAIETQGCPCLQSCGHAQENLQGQVLIVPHAGMKASVGRYLHEGTCGEVGHGFHSADTTVGSWSMAITEIPPASTLFEQLTSSQLTQVFIPFEADADPAHVKQHVLSTMAKVVAKEAVTCRFPETKVISTGKVSARAWMDMHKLDRLKMTGSPKDGLQLSNVSTSERSIGVYISRVPLTRTNSYFEIVVEPAKSKKLAILMGCLYDHLFMDRHPMDSTVDHGGYVDGFDASNDEKTVIGFGIDEWESEYLPSPSAKYYFSVNGEKRDGKVEDEHDNPRNGMYPLVSVLGDEVGTIHLPPLVSPPQKDGKIEASSNDNPRNGMYPLVSILGEEVGTLHLPPLVSPPQDLLQRWKKDNRWIEKGCKFNCMVDNHGNLRYMSNYESAGHGFFLGRQEVGEENNSFTVELTKLAANVGGSTHFQVGIAGELYRMDKVKDSSVIQITVNLSPFYTGWPCSQCKFENEGHSKTCVSCSSGSRPQEAVNPTAWKCSECKTANENKQEQCKSCKKGTKPQGYGDWKQEVFTQINDQIETKVLENLPVIKEGDTFAVNVSDSADNVTKVIFCHNDKQISFRNFVFKPGKPCRPVPFIMVDNEDDHLRLRNFRPTYRQPAPIQSKVTVGRANFLAVRDDGTVEYRAEKSTANTYGLFVAKTPFRRDQLEFTVEATSLGTNQLFGIGVTDPDYPLNTFLGWKHGSVAYHADNGGMYMNSSSGTFMTRVGPDKSSQGSEVQIRSGDVVSVRVEHKEAGTPLKFDTDGNLDTQQAVKLVFSRNNKPIHEVQHEVLGQGLYPAFSLKAATVKIRNFYAETAQVWEQLDSSSQETKKSKKEESSKKSEPVKQHEEQPYCGTEFVVVGVSAGASDVAGKLQILQQQLDLGNWPQLTTVTQAIADMDTRLGELGVAEQRTYGELCAMEDNMKLLAHNPARISYIKADLDTPQCRSELLEKVGSIQERHRSLQAVRYNISDYYHRVQQHLLQQLATHKLINVNTLLHAAGNTAGEGEAPAGEYGWLHKFADIDGNTLLAHLRDLQNKGRLLLLDEGSGLVAVEIGFVLDLEGEMGHLLPTQMVEVGMAVPCIGQSSHVWSETTLEEFQRKIAAGPLSHNKMVEVKAVLQQALGVIQLPCLRTDSSDMKYIYVTQQNVTNPPVPMVEYWSPQMDNTDYVVMRQTYTFPLTMHEHLMSLLIANTARYGRIVILTGEGVVYQTGAVQTVIVKTQDTQGCECVLVVSRCYTQHDAAMSKQIASYVQDYTWNIFSMFTDLLDDLLHRSHVPFLVNRDWPQELVNVSVGCKHCWVTSSAGVRQTVCTLCNQCCDKGGDCDWNGMMGEHLRQCGCGTEVDGCKDCGICTRCAEALWGVRSRLRPFSTVMTSVIQTTDEKKKMKQHKEGDQEEGPALRDPLKQPSITLDPFCYNEVEFTNTSREEKVICLREESVGTILQAYPGRAKKIEDTTSLTFKEVYQDRFKLNIGDQIKLKISDPQGVSFKAVAGEGSQEEKLVIETQFFSVQAREVKIMQETGIVIYDTVSPTIPVGQFIGCKPLTKENDTFSVRILSKGQKGMIAIGLVPANYPPNRQPGWNSQSIGYHADDGGIFLESGYPTRKTKPATQGDIMTLYIDFVKDKGWFRKNGEKCIELNLNPSRLGYYPCVAFHSVGEAVQILEKDLWTAASEEDRNRKQPSLPTYKYGNLWISPGKRINLMKLGGRYCGWVILHNPQKDPVGFKVRTSKKESFFGVIEHKKEWVKNISIAQSSDLADEVTVEWTSLESGRTYTEGDMKKMFGIGQENVHQSGHVHRLPCTVQESANVVEELQKVSSGPPKEQCLCLHVYKNLALVEEYWLNLGSYQVLVESNSKADFILKYPKCPAFNYSKTFQKGMIVILDMAGIGSEKTQQAVYAESIVVDVYSGGKRLALEYSPKDKSSNVTICIVANTPALTFTHFAEEQATVWRYEARNTPSNLTRTFYSAPPYLLSEGAIKVFNFINKEWKSNVLKTFSVCYQDFTRLTVQEKHMCSASRSLLEWTKFEVNYFVHTFLPAQLSHASLVYPRPANMFSDIAVHSMCYSSDELLTQAGLGKNIAWRIPLHFVDIPGIMPSSPLPPEATFGDGLVVWTYIALISNRLYLPAYANMMAGDVGQLSRLQVEQLLHNMLQIYGALCSIYSATWGGLEFCKTHEDEHAIKDAIRHDTSHLVQLSGKPRTETDRLFLLPNSSDATCKAHSLSMKGSDYSYPEGLQFDYNYFEPYTDLVNMFHWSVSKLSGLPDDFFEKFRNLQYFRLGDPTFKMNRFEKLPEGISKCKLLKVVEITETAMTELPSDFFLSPSIIHIWCADMPIKALPDLWPETSQITELVLSGLLLTEITPKLSCLQNLEWLELCYNPITDLPESLASLKLKKLHLTGSMWLTLEGKRNQMTKEQYDKWHLMNPSCINYFGRQKMEELFLEFDFNHNGSLDEEELAALNLKLFFGMPRIGLADINDEVTGGIPRVVFSLSSLNELHLDYCAVTTVPQAINNLQNLKILSLNHNPLLMSLPGSLGHLPNIKGIRINSCPAIRTPPTEVVSRGFESVKAYLKRLAGGYTECRRTKLMVVGLGGAGKTSLLRALMSATKTTSGTEKEIPTDGIDIVPWTVSSDDGREVTYSTWDFAGQAVYYNTHQFFLSKRAVYLLLWSMRQGYEHAGLDFWLSSICCHAPGTPILVVGTQCDLIPQAEIPEKELMDRYPQIASFHQVSSIKGTNILELQKSLLDITLQQGYMGEKIPQVWLNFEKRILAERLTKKSYIQWEVARQYAMEQGIYDEKDVRLAIQLLHDLGTVQYFDNDFLRDYVVINPQWIVNVMACVVSAQDSPIQKHKGRFLHRDIGEVWKEYSASLHSWLLRLTEDFDLTFPLPKEAINIVPCLLPSEPPEDLHWPSVRGQQGIRETKMVYRFTYLPSGLFNRAQVRLFQFSDGKMIWKKGSLLSKNKHLALIKQTDSKELVVFVQGPRPENIVFLIHEVFESIIEESFNGVNYEMFLPCPDCVLKEGTSDPDLLNSKLIQRAKDMKAPFLQCYKYFHWISMAQLQEKLPADSREVSDLDMQLQQSIVALQELNNDLMMDTAIIYTSKDVPLPGDPNRLPPSLIRDDIVSWGYSCWFAEDMDTVSYVDMTAAIKNCKVLLALVSDDFESDTKCCDMFLHAKETMNKDIIVVVLGDSLAWQDNDLGIKIGKQERVLMAKTLPRYTNEGGRRDELKDWLAEKMAAQARVESDSLDVFVSYAWTNSKEAQERSGKVNKSCIGWGDPRSLKAAIQKDGLSCWLDVEQIGREKQGIFADMASGIRNSKVILACISDEYADSDNCMMELRFGILNMNLPLVVAVVGQGSSWKEKEVAMLMRRAKASEVYLQNENDAGVSTLVQYVKTAITDEALSSKKKKKKDEAGKDMKDGGKLGGKSKEEKKAQEQKASIAYKEEYELVQRRFMRHILGSISTVDTLPVPRLMLIDFVKAVAGVKEGDGRESKEGHPSMSSSSFSMFSKRKLRPRSGRKSRDRLQIDESVFEDDDKEDWSKESFCLKLMCENEAGWHLCPERLPLAFRTRDSLESFLQKGAPYLYRIYSLLSQSPIKLKCFAPGKGQAYQDWMRAESEANSDFIGAMQHLRSELTKDEAADFVGCLARCRLPSGKILWLCGDHQQQQHVARLSTSSAGGSYNLHKVLHNEDKLFLDNLEKSPEYKALKGKPSTKTVPMLPEPMPIPVFAPAPPPPDREATVPPPAPDAGKTKAEENKDEKTPRKAQSPKDAKPQTQLRRELSLTRTFGDYDSDSEETSQTQHRRERSRSRSPVERMPREQKDSTATSKTEYRRQRSVSRERLPQERKEAPQQQPSQEPPTLTAKTELRRPSSAKRTAPSPRALPKTPDADGTANSDALNLLMQDSGPDNARRADEKASRTKPTDDYEIHLQPGKHKDTKPQDWRKVSKAGVKAGSKGDVTDSTRKQSLTIDGSNTKSSLSPLNQLMQSSVKQKRGGERADPPGGKADQLQRKTSLQTFSSLQRGSTVRRHSTRAAPPGAQSSLSHRQVPDTVSQDLKLSLKIQTVGDTPDSSLTSSISSSSPLSDASKPRSKAPSNKSPLEKVRPRKIAVKPKSDRTEPSRRTSFKASGTAVGVTNAAGNSMALPDSDGSRACTLQ